MNYFIEVTSNERSFLEKIEGYQGLQAPATRRHTRLLSKIKKGDHFLHYLTWRTHTKGWRGAFVGKSIAASSIKKTEREVTVELRDVTSFKKAVKLFRIKRDCFFSEKLSRAIEMSMQSYLLEIEESDYYLILNLSEDVDEEG